MLRRNLLSTTLALGGAGMRPGAARAEDYPSRPVRIIVPFEAGAPDSVARLVGQQMAMQMGRPFVVENRPGANGTIGTAVVARAAPDGYTLLVCSSSFVVNPSIYRRLPYDVRADFAPVTQLCLTEALIVGVNPALPVRSLPELVAYARTHDLTYGSPGVGNVLHLAAELLNAKTGIRMVHAPYKGAGPALTALLAGEVQVMFMTPPLSLPYVRAGNIRALAYTARDRASFLPDIPSVMEAGMPDLVIDGGWHGLFAPAETPDPILQRLQSEASAALRVPSVVERLDILGLLPVGSNTPAFRTLVSDQLVRYAELVQAAGIAPE